MAATTLPPSRIAVIDDDMPFIRFVERALATAHVGIQPVTTLDPEEALRVVAATTCDAALVDLYMYGAAAGFDFIERMRAYAPTARIPIVLTTGARREVARNVKFLQAQRCNVLLKPFVADELFAVLHQLCGPRPDLEPEPWPPAYAVRTRRVGLVHR